MRTPTSTGDQPAKTTRIYPKTIPGTAQWNRYIGPQTESKAWMFQTEKSSLLPSTEGVTQKEGTSYPMYGRRALRKNITLLTTSSSVPKLGKATQKIQKYLSPKKTKVMEKKQLFLLVNQQGRSITNLLIDLRKLSSPRNYGNK